MPKTDKLGLTLLTDTSALAPAPLNENFQKIENYAASLTQICTVRDPADLLTAVQRKTLNFATMVKSGYVFSLSGGSVAVSEPGFVRVQAHVNVRDLQTGDSIIVEILKNWSSCWMFDQVDASEDWVTLDVTSGLMPCAANDVFGANVCNTDIDRGRVKQEATYLTVEFYRDLNFAG